MKRIAVIFGGMSNEAEVSVMSARNVLAYIDKAKFEAVPLFWRKDGSLLRVTGADDLDKGEAIRFSDLPELADVVLPVTHGKYGEDGCLQGILESLHIPYCGCRVLSSALCMDKAVFKSLIAASGLPQTPYVVLDFSVQTAEGIQLSIDKAKASLKLPWFVKPANSGSSVGVTRVDDADSLASAIDVAKEHDDKVIIEQGVEGAMEVEVAVLGNGELTISRPGQIIASRDFYDYEDKYIVGTSEVKIPASLSTTASERVREMASRAYRLSDCRGFARIDFFVNGEEVLLNEINTLPGFTNISMYPKLMADAGISYPNLLTRIIELAY